MQQYASVVQCADALPAVRAAKDALRTVLLAHPGELARNEGQCLVPRHADPLVPATHRAIGRAAFTEIALAHVRMAHAGGGINQVGIARISGSAGELMIGSAVNRPPCATARNAPQCAALITPFGLVACALAATAWAITGGAMTAAVPAPVNVAASRRNRRRDTPASTLRSFMTISRRYLPALSLACFCVYSVIIASCSASALTRLRFERTMPAHWLAVK